MKTKKVLPLISLLFVAIMLLSVGMIEKEYRERQQDIKGFEKLEDIITEVEQTEMTDNVKQTETPQEQKQSSRNLTPLFEANGDCIGWICISDTAVNYPVMYTPEEPQKYLRKNFEGEYSASGVPFLDVASTPECDSLIIYGHNMNDGSMFGSLKKYKDDGFWKENQYFTVYSETTAYRYRIFSYEDAVNGGDVYKVGYQPGEEYQKFIDQMIKDSDVDTGVKPQTSNKILTLSTCTGNGYSKRLAIHAVCIDAQTTDESKLKETGN